MKDKLLILTGPTGVGKTSLSIKMAREIDAEIISADSMQIYRGLNIGTDKITEREMQGIPHHLLDIADPEENFSVAEYKRLSTELIGEINSRGKIAMVVGGTGLYINSLVYRWDFQNVESDPEYREYLQEILEERGLPYLFDKLEKLDPVSAENTDRDNPSRVIRALEIVNQGGEKKSENLKTQNDDYDLLMIGLTMDRQRLYERINKRVDEMIDNKLLDEVEDLLKTVPRDAQSLKAIGYREMVSYLEGEISFERAVELIKQHSRNYAKRQITWFKRDARINWFDVDSCSLESIVELARSYYGI